MDGYNLQLASSVGERDGFGVELVTSSGEVVAEVFQDDLTGERTVSFFTDSPVPLPAIERLIERARTTL